MLPVAKFAVLNYICNCLFFSEAMVSTWEVKSLCPNAVCSRFALLFVAAYTNYSNTLMFIVFYHFILGGYTH